MIVVMRSLYTRFDSSTYLSDCSVQYILQSTKLTTIVLTKWIEPSEIVSYIVVVKAGVLLLFV